MANEIFTNVTGYVVPINNTRRRASYSTYSAEMGLFPAGAKIDIDQVIERVQSEQGKVHDAKGDVWGRVIAVSGVALEVPTYVAITYHNTTTFINYDLCKKYYSFSTPEEDVIVVEHPDFIVSRISKSDGTIVSEQKYIPE